MKMKNEKITGESRLVWMGGPGQGGEALAAAAAETGKKAPPPAPAPSPEDAAAARARQTTEGAARAGAAAQEEPEKNAQAEAILAALSGSGGDATTALAESIELNTDSREFLMQLQNPLTSQELNEWTSKYEPQIKALQTAYKKKSPEESRKMAEEIIKMLDEPGSKLALRVLFAPPTQKEKDRFISKYSTDENLDLKQIVTSVNNENWTLRDTRIFVTLLKENPPKIKTALEKANSDIRTIVKKWKGWGDKTLSSIETLLPTYSPKQVDAAFKKSAYKSAYGKFLDDGNKETFLAGITDLNDKAIIKWALEAPVTKAEKIALAAKLEPMIASKTIQGPKNDDDIKALVSTQKINYREGMILKALRVEEEGTGPEIPAELKGLGLVELITKLVEKLTALMEKLGTKLDTMFKSKNEFPKSPIGGDKGFIIEQAQTGVNLKADPPGQDVTAVMDGKVTEVKGNTITIEVANGAKITYTGITQKPGLKKDDTIKAGETLGKMTSDTLNFQMSDSAGTAMDKAALETLLGKYKKTPPEATQTPETTTALPEFKYAQPPIPLSGDTKLTIKSAFNAKNPPEGITITAAKDTQVQMISDGKITKAENGEVVVEFQGGKKLVYKGLVIDAGMSAKSGQQMTAGATIGKINDKGELAIQAFQGDQQVDPAADGWLKQWIAQ